MPARLPAVGIWRTQQERTDGRSDCFQGSPKASLFPCSGPHFITCSAPAAQTSTWVPSQTHGTTLRWTERPPGENTGGFNHENHPASVKNLSRAKTREALIQFVQETSRGVISKGFYSNIPFISRNGAVSVPSSSMTAVVSQQAPTSLCVQISARKMNKG